MDNFHISNGHGPRPAAESETVETEFVVRVQEIRRADGSEPRLALAFWTGLPGQEKCVVFGFRSVEQGLGVARGLQERAELPPFTEGEHGPPEFDDPGWAVAPDFGAERVAVLIEGFGTCLWRPATARVIAEGLSAIADAVEKRAAA